MFNFEEKIIFGKKYADITREYGIFCALKPHNSTVTNVFNIF